MNDFGSNGANFTAEVLKKAGIKYFGITYGKFDSSQVSLSTDRQLLIKHKQMKWVSTITFEGFSQYVFIASVMNVTLLHFVQTIIPQYGGRQSLKEVIVSVTIVPNTEYNVL